MRPEGKRVYGGGMEPERVPYAMTEAGLVYAERYVDADGRAWVAPCGTRVEDVEQWTPDPAAK